MYLKEIYIQNFKGFEKKKFLFNSRFNVAIGNNATGKSTLLHAIQVALGGYLQCLNIPATTIYLRQFKKDEVFTKWDYIKKDFIINDEPTLISTTAQFSHVKHETKWTRVKLKNSTSQNQRDTGQLILDVKKIAELKSAAFIQIPIVASFGTGRTIAQLRKGKKAQSRRSNMEKGFLAALSEKVDFDGVIEWIHNYDKNLKYEKEFEGTKIAFYNAIETAIPYLKEVEYNNFYHEFEAEITIDDNSIGKTLHSNMSDGLKAMLNLVAELAFRCVILNGFKGENAVKATEGIVLIDELDMHLHPTWQMHVVSNLKGAFPNLQFIVTTHSPFIVQSLKADELIILEEDIQSEGDPFRRSIEEISSAEMGIKDIPRSKLFSEMEDIATEYFNLIELGKTSENDTQVAHLRAKLNELEDVFSEDPAFVALLKSERKSNNI